MKIGLTGWHPDRPMDGPGFIGSWLRADLAGAGHDVTMLPWDVRRTLVPPGWDLSRLDMVVHLAARVGRLLCDRDPRDVIDTNAWGTYNVARACAAAGTRMLYVSSSEAAHDNNLYGLTKRWGEDAAYLAFGGEDQLLLPARLFMPYGPGHPPGHGRAALTNWLWQAMNSQTLTVHHPSSRPWCWVGDTVRGIRLLCEQETWRGLPPFVNVGRTDNIMLSKTVAERIVERYGADGARVELVDVPAGVAPWKSPVGYSLQELGLGWQPEVDLDDGVARTHTWLEENRARFAQA